MHAGNRAHIILTTHTHREQTFFRHVRFQTLTDTADVLKPEGLSFSQQCYSVSVICGQLIKVLR